LDPQEALTLLDRNKSHFFLLDVRTSPENARLRIPGSTLIPVHELHARLDEIEKQMDILVYCEHGYRSLQIANLLMQLGWPKVYNLRGGIVKWKGPVEGKDA